MTWREAFASAFYWAIVTLMVGFLLLSFFLSFYVPVVAMAWGVILVALSAIAAIAVCIKVINR